MLWVFRRLNLNGSLLRLEVVIEENPGRRYFCLKAGSEPMIGMMVACGIPGLIWVPKDRRHSNYTMTWSASSVLNVMKRLFTPL